MYMNGDCCLAAHVQAKPPWTYQCECHNQPRVQEDKRTAKDYAIEHGGYLADAAEAYMQAINKYSAGEEDSDYLTDHWRALQNAIGEFRKRAIRAISESKG
jgi:hypothetical protein